MDSNSTSLLQFSENLLCMMRGAMMMLFGVMIVNLHSLRKENSILNSLFWLLIVMSILLALTFCFMIEEIREYRQFYNFVMMLNLCLIPLIGAFLLKVVIPDCINVKKTVLLLSPAIICAVVYTFRQNSILFHISFVYTALVAAIIFFFVIIYSIRYDRYLKNNYSNIDNRTVRWVRVVTYIFAGWYLIWSFVLIQDNRMLDSIYYIFLIIIWCFIYKFSIKHIATFHTQEMFETPEKTITKQNQFEKGVTNTTNLIEKLEKYMIQEKIWLNTSLTLQDLAIGLDTNRTYLSEYFNKTLNMTFYDYLNKYRIKHACCLLITNSDLSISHVGEQSGFNSLSTFRRAFEKQMRCTPSIYRKINKKAAQ